MLSVTRAEKPRDTRTNKDKHAARDKSRADARADHVCEICWKPFNATDVRQTVHPECRKDTLEVLADGRIVSIGERGGSRKIRPPKETYFVPVDGEGLQGKCHACPCELFDPKFPDDDTSVCTCGHDKYKSHDHNYVLLGVGQDQKEWPNGCQDITEIFEYLYDQFQANPGATFVGFFLGYDFNCWLRLLPRERAAMLLTSEGIAKRTRKFKGGQIARRPHPVEYKGWLFDSLAGKRFSLRPKLCACRNSTCKCAWQKTTPWMHICDTGPFFQASLLSVINPADWKEPIVSDKEFEILQRGKDSRSVARLDNDMRYYNRLENDVLARVLDRLNHGFIRAGIVLRNDQWFGPGQPAQSWMRKDDKLGAVMRAVEGWSAPMRDAFIASYYGGIFEIQAHGIVPGVTYEYDLNSAYPYVISRLPCICDDSKWTHGNGKPRRKMTHDWILDRAGKTRDETLRLCHVKVTGSDPYMGGLQHRRPDGQILRPLCNTGWHWQHEIDASIKAGLIDTVEYLEYYEHKPCGHRAPLRSITGLYDGRIAVGKDSSEGKAYKLMYNSVYGKLAQSEGSPVFANPVYASLVTSGCRTLIVEAIASHPMKSRAVVMIATDGVYFLTPHPGIDAESAEEIARTGKGEDERLGYWGRKEKVNMALFKPGVYWDDKAREAIRDGKAAKFKARGINARAFSQTLAGIDAQFRAWDREGRFIPKDKAAANDITYDAPENQFPHVQFKSYFSQVSVTQALAWSRGPESWQNETRHLVATPGNPVKPSELARANSEHDDMRQAKYVSVAGRVSSGETLVQDSRPDIKREVLLGMTYDPEFDIWRSSPHSYRMAKESSPYEKRFGTDDGTIYVDEMTNPDTGTGLVAWRAMMGTK